jgi:CubicO group peptidase (beta-lactamase class C family)
MIAPAPVGGVCLERVMIGLRLRWLAVLATFVAGAAAAQPLAPAPKTPPAPAASAPLPAQPSASASLTRADLESWLDGFMPYALERGDIPGAVVAVVKDGQPLLIKGYGYADLATKAPVTADTLFRPGSVSKLFTWTAVMQLVGQGKLDLDRDVNDYLDFKIPARPGGPVTLRRLMTHTAGFEETVQNLLVTDVKRVEPLSQALKDWIPNRVYPVGDRQAYSNYGAALAGYIVQRVSGEPYEQYVERHILSPLDMTHSTMREPLPAQLQPFMSKGYPSASNGKAQAYELISLSPAGALAASGSDMAKFMIAQLADEKGAGLLLAPDVAHTMHHTFTTSIGPLNRMALGFYESNLNGHEIISHGGDTNWFHSDLNLFLDDGVGIFINMNSPGREAAAHQVRGALLRAFADRYFPGPTPSGAVTPQMAKEHAQMFAGVYQSSRASFSDFASLADFIGQNTVTAMPDGTIVVSNLVGLNGQPHKWREIAPFIWKNVDGQDRLAVIVKDGKVVRFSGDELAPIMEFDRVPWTISSAWLMPALVAGLAALALTLILWPVAVLARRKYGAAFALRGSAAASHRAVRIGALAPLLVAGGWTAIIVLGLENLELFGPPFAPWIAALGVLGPIALLAALATALWDAVEIWRGRRGWRSWFARLWSLVLVLSVGVTIWVVLAFHLYGLNSHY